MNNNYEKIIRAVNDNNIDEFQVLVFDIENNLDESSILALLMELSPKYLFYKTLINEISSKELLEFDKTNRPLMYAIQNNYVEIVELLLTKGIDPNLPDGRRLNEAYKLGNEQIIKLLIANGADIQLAVNDSIKTPEERYAIKNYSKKNE